MRRASAGRSTRPVVLYERELRADKQRARGPRKDCCLTWRAWCVCVCLQRYCKGMCDFNFCPGHAPATPQLKVKPHGFSGFTTSCMAHGVHHKEPDPTPANTHARRQCSQDPRLKIILCTVVTRFCVSLVGCSSSPPPPRASRRI